MRRPRRNHSPVFKAKVALAAIEGSETLAQLADRFDLHAHQIAQWRTQLLARAAEVFAAAEGDLALGQVRGGLPVRLRDRFRGPGRPRPLLHLLQPAASPRCAPAAHPGCRVLFNAAAKGDSRTPRNGTYPGRLNCLKRSDHLSQEIVYETAFPLVSRPTSTFFFQAAIVLVAACGGPTLPDTRLPATSVERQQQPRFLPYGRPVPPGDVTLPPEPYQLDRHGPPIVNTNPESARMPLDDPLLRRHEIDRRRSQPASPTPPPPGTGDRGFYIHQGIGIYAGNDPQRDLNIPSSAFGVTPYGNTGAVIYAPTHMAPLSTGTTRACLEATTIHERYAGWPATDDLHGFWDWCAATPGFQIRENMNATSWLGSAPHFLDRVDRLLL